MNGNELKRKLRILGAVIETGRGKGSHMQIKLGNRITHAQNHGNKEVPIGTLRAIRRQLGITTRRICRCLNSPSLPISNRMNPGPSSSPFRIGIPALPTAQPWNRPWRPPLTC
ncbi:MAG: type II toxin-antitoxin system HicA family toxin [Magnetococcales bacterium]|nr:type II toxin-antitoxin system HicA family toxin [Magnetococcales bacterium]